MTDELSARERPTLAAPSTDLDGFPEQPLGGDVPLFRVVRAGNAPWWFDSSGAGRFDLTSPRGTCYLATEDVVALVEVIGGDVRDGVVARSFVEARRLRELRVPFAHRLALLAARGARRFGVTAEIHTVVPYDLPQRWAAALDAAGFDGVAYRARHDPSGRGTSVALFGRAGERTSWRRGRAQRISTALLARLRSEFGVAVADVPVSAQLRLLD